MDFQAILRDPIVSPLIVLLVLTLAIFFLSVSRAIQTGTLDATLLPRFVRDYILGEFFPLAVLGSLVWLVGQVYPEGNREIVQTLGLGALAAAYGTGIAAAVAKYLVKLLALISGPQPGIDREIDQPVSTPT